MSSPETSHEHGFTLLEMLITLVVVSAVTSLLWQALALTARLEQTLGQSRGGAQALQLRQAWVSQALRGLAVPPGTQQPFTGSRLRLEAVTTDPPWPGSQGPEPMVMELVVASGSGSPSAALDLIVIRPATGERLNLGRWAPRMQFSYLDANARWQEKWPPEDRAESGNGGQRPLPRAIRLGPVDPPAASDDVGEMAAPDVIAQVLLVAPLATRNPMLSRAQVGGSDDELR